MGCRSGKACRAEEHRVPEEKEAYDGAATAVAAAFVPRLPTEAWLAEMLARGMYPERLAVIEKTEHRGISLIQLRDLAEFVEKVGIPGLAWKNSSSDMVSEEINLYHICDFFVKPITHPFKCAFAEMVAQGSQVPVWFVSHWWGTPFNLSCRMLTFHSMKRGVRKTDCYWICTFANNQHDLSELSGKLCDTPFVKVILSEISRGTVVLLDAEVTPFTRIWCVLENQVSTVDAMKEKDLPHAYDLATLDGSGEVVLRLDNGPTHPAWEVGERLSEEGSDDASFPSKVALVGINTDITVAKASRPEDRRMILHFIADTPEAMQKDEPPQNHHQYATLNYNTQIRFASVALREYCKEGMVDKACHLLRKFPDVQDEVDATGWTAAHLAAMNGHATALQALGQAKANFNKESRNGSPLCVCSIQGHVSSLQVLLDYRADVNQIDSSEQDDHVTPLDLARRCGNADAAALLASAGALCAGEVPLIKLVETRANVNTRIRDRVPICTAIENEYTTALRALIGARANLEMEQGGSGPSGRTPLVLTFTKKASGTVETSVEKGDSGVCAMEMLQMLIKAKADVNRQDRQGNTPSHLAAWDGNVPVLRALLDARADVNLAAHNGKTLLDITVLKRCPEVTALLESAGARSGEDIFMDRIQALIKAKADINAEVGAEESGWTPLLIAAQHGWIGAIEMLIDAQVILDRIPRSGTKSATFLAVENLHVEVLRLLIDAKADVNLPDLDLPYFTPLDIIKAMRRPVDEIEHEKKGKVQAMLEAAGAKTSM